MTMLVKPTCGDFKRDTDVFSKMDPYCVVDINGQKHQTKVHNNGGKKPVWNDQLVFKVNGLERVAKLMIYDKDVCSSDFVCEATLSLNGIFQNKHFSGWVPCTYKGKPSGQIMVAIEVMGGNQGHNIQNQQNMNFAQQGVFQMPGMPGFAPQPQAQFPFPTQANPNPSMIP